MNLPPNVRPPRRLPNHDEPAHGTVAPVLTFVPLGTSELVVSGVSCLVMRRNLPEQVRTGRCATMQLRNQLTTGDRLVRSGISTNPVMSSSIPISIPIAAWIPRDV